MGTIGCAGRNRARCACATGFAGGFQVQRIGTWCHVLNTAARVPEEVLLLLDSDQARRQVRLRRLQLVVDDAQPAPGKLVTEQALAHCCSANQCKDQVQTQLMHAYARTIRMSWESAKCTCTNQNPPVLQANKKFYSLAQDLTRVQRRRSSGRALTPMGPMPGPPPPCGMQNVLCRFRWHTSAPMRPGDVRPTCAACALNFRV